MATSTKLEFAVQMTCQSCVDAIKNVLEAHKDIKKLSINLDKEQVLVETTLPTHNVQQLIESTGRRAVLMGLGSTAGDGHLGAAVSIVTGSSGCQGIVRMIQVSPDLCVIEGTIDHLTPGKHSVVVHELGDLSQGCFSCGDVFNLGTEVADKKNGELCTLEADPKGRLEFRIESTLLKVWDIIGRSLVIHHHNNDKDERVACGVVARSAGLFQNPKRICACDGVALWDERDVPAAGVGRQRAAAQAQL